MHNSEIPDWIKQVRTDETCYAFVLEVQKNGGYKLEHPYSQDENARKVFYYLLQIAHLFFQLMEKGSLFRKAFPDGVGSLKNIADRLLEAWRNLRLDDQAFISLYSGKFQIRFDSSWILSPA